VFAGLPKEQMADRLYTFRATMNGMLTHHLPHPRSIHPRFADDPLTPAFCSDLSDLVEGSRAALWVHGHTHTSCEYIAGNTRVACNPKGYGPQSPGGRIENEQFDENLVIEI